MDEELRRVVARMVVLKVEGSLGILIAAFKQKIITIAQLNDYFEQISHRRDIWISSLLCERQLENLKQPPC